MSDEMKLLMALCDALGFDVETKYDYKERRISKTHAMQINRGYNVSPKLSLQTNGRHNMLDIDDDGMYLARLEKPIISYSLTNKVKQ